MRIQDRIEERTPEFPLSRYAPIPIHYDYFIREQFNDDGTIIELKRVRMYDNGDMVIEEKK